MQNTVVSSREAAWNRWECREVRTQNSLVLGRPIRESHFSCLTPQVGQHMSHGSWRTGGSCSPSSPGGHILQVLQRSCSPSSPGGHILQGVIFSKFSRGSCSPGGHILQVLQGVMLSRGSCSPSSGGGFIFSKLCSPNQVMGDVAPTVPLHCFLFVPRNPLFPSPTLTVQTTNLNTGSFELKFTFELIMNSGLKLKLNSGSSSRCRTREALFLKHKGFYVWHKIAKTTKNATFSSSQKKLHIYNSSRVTRNVQQRGKDCSAILSRFQIGTFSSEVKRASPFPAFIYSWQWTSNFTHGASLHTNQLQSASGYSHKFNFPSTLSGMQTSTGADSRFCWLPVRNRKLCPRALGLGGAKTERYWLRSGAQASAMPVFLGGCHNDHDFSHLTTRTEPWSDILRCS